MACVQHQRPWTEAEDALLRKLWSEGLSARQIAAQLNGRSRNSAVGRVFRLGLAKRKHDTTSARLAQSRNRKPRARTVPRAPKAPAQRSAAHLPLREALILSLPPTEPRRDIGSISHGECRFMCGDPLEADHAFCARPTDGGTAWCRHHRWLVAAPDNRPALERTWRAELEQQDVGLGA